VRKIIKKQLARIIGASMERFAVAEVFLIGETKKVQPVHGNRGRCDMRETIFSTLKCIEKR
jgi:hypothetical protein